LKIKPTTATTATKQWFYAQKKFLFINKTVAVGVAVVGVETTPTLLMPKYQRKTTN